MIDQGTRRARYVIGGRIFYQRPLTVGQMQILSAMNYRELLAELGEAGEMRILTDPKMLARLMSVVLTEGNSKLQTSNSKAEPPLVPPHNGGREDGTPPNPPVNGGEPIQITEEEVAGMEYEQLLEVLNDFFTLNPVWGRFLSTSLASILILQQAVTNDAGTDRSTGSTWPVVPAEETLPGGRQ